MSTALSRGEHGRYVTYAQGCRCTPCTTAMRRYFREYFAARSLLRRGDAVWMVDGRRTADHLQRLLAGGWTYRKIAAEIGCGPQTLAGFAHRARHHRDVRCWNVVARGVLSLEPRSCWDS